MKKDVWNKRTREEVEIIVKNLGYTLLDEYYRESDEKRRRVAIQDLNGYKWDGVLSSLINKNRGISFFEKRNPYTLENISLWLYLNRPEFELCKESFYNEAAGNSLIVFHNIQKCQDSFSVSWNNIFNGQGCSICSGKKVGKRTSLAYLRPDLAKEWHPNNIIKPENITVSSGKRVYWICSNPECRYGANREWSSLISNRTNSGCGCPACAGQVVTDRNRLSIVRPDIALEWDYNKNSKIPSSVSYGSGKKFWWLCSKGHSFYSSVGDRTSGYGCLKCSSSKGENRISNWVENNVSNLQESGIIGCTPEKRFPDCKDKLSLPFDFGFEYFNSTWSVTEFQGEQHFFPVDFGSRGVKWAEKQFKETKRRDAIKKKYCEDNNIPLLIIPYWEFDNIERILTENLL